MCLSGCYNASILGMKKQYYFICCLQLAKPCLIVHMSVCAGQGKFAYIYRPALLGSCRSVEGTCLELGTSEALQLPGFGVELAIKNMEYSAMDDSKVCSHHI